MRWPSLRRITSGGAYLPEIDGLRFLAIGAVFLFHLAGMLAAKGGPWSSDPSGDWLAIAASYGSYGVQLFFGISGFVLGVPFAAERLAGGPRVDRKAYFLRRLTRLEPPYLLALLLLFAAHAVWKGEGAAETLPHLAASAGYVHNLAYGYRSPVMTVAWSLEIEVQFYLLMPLLAAAFALRGAALRRSVWVAGVLGAVALQKIVRIESSRLYLSILGEAQYFFVGLLAADIYVSEGSRVGTWDRRPAPSAARDGLFLLALAALVPTFAFPAATPWALPFVVLALLVGGLGGGAARRALSVPLLATIGGMCYTIYLFHLDLLSLASRATFGLRTTSSFAVNLLVQAVVLGAVVGCACAVFFALVERPCMRRDWPRRAWDRLRGRSSA